MLKLFVLQYFVFDIHESPAILFDQTITFTVSISYHAYNYMHSKLISHAIQDLNYMHYRLT